MEEFQDIKAGRQPQTKLLLLGFKLRPGQARGGSCHLHLLTERVDITQGLGKLPG
jgi:hypothetical protein